MQESGLQGYRGLGRLERKAVKSPGSGQAEARAASSCRVSPPSDSRKPPKSSVWGRGGEGLTTGKGSREDEKAGPCQNLERRSRVWPSPRTHGSTGWAEWRGAAGGGGTSPAASRQPLSAWPQWDGFPAHLPSKPKSSLCFLDSGFLLPHIILDAQSLKTFENLYLIL